MRLFFSFFLIFNVAFAADAEVAPLPTSVKTEFVYPDFTQCYEKNRQSIVYFGKTRAVAIGENKAVAYSKEKPTVPFIKHDYLSNLYLFESPKPLIPIKLKPTETLKPGEWFASMSENSLVVVNISKIGSGANNFFEHSGRGDENSIIGGLCCEMSGLGIGDKFFIGSEGLEKFIHFKSAAYAELGARLEENNETIVVDFVDPNNKEAKLKAGDKIVALNGKKVKNLAEVSEALMSSKSSSKLSAQIQRDNAWIEENILAIKPKPVPKKVVPVVKKENYLETKGLKFDNDMKLLDISAHSFAEKSGLKAGDRLIQIDETRIDKVSEAENFLAKTRNREINLLFDRNDFQFFVTLKR